MELARATRAERRISEARKGLQREQYFYESMLQLSQPYRIFG